MANAESHGEVSRLHAAMRHLALEADIAELRATNVLATDAMQSLRYEPIKGLLYAFFDETISKSEVDFSKEVALNAIGLAMGLAPGVGFAYDLGSRLIVLATQSDAGASATREHMAYVIDYGAALSAWIGVAEPTIERVEKETPGDDC